MAAIVAPDGVRSIARTLACFDEALVLMADCFAGAFREPDFRVCG
jgi:hypothetical protein